MRFVKSAVSLLHFPSKAKDPQRTLRVFLMEMEDPIFVSGSNPAYLASSILVTAIHFLPSFSDTLPLATTLVTELQTFL